MNTPTTWARDEQHGLDKPKVQMVSRLVEDEDAYIVLSTAWRVHHPFGTLVSWLDDRGLRRARHRVIDKTPVHRDMTKRGGEIREWLVNHPGVESYVAIDDNDWLDGIKHRWVRTDWRIGLTPKHIEMARTHLQTIDARLKPAV